jgi:hypothetical protein
VNDVEADFIEEQVRAIRELAAQSDIFEVDVRERRTFVFRYDCTGLVALRGNDVRPHTGFEVSCYLHEDYLRRVNPLMLLNLAEPERCWHPSVSAPLLCIGTVAPGTPLVELAQRAYEVVTYQNVGGSERDALRPEACAYVRANLERFPIDPRPLRWRRGDGGAAEPRDAR